MNLANKQITFHKPQKISTAINDGIRALAERYNGSIQSATDHCLLRIHGLTEAKLTRSRAKKPPHYTRDGQSFITLIWVLMVDGLMPYRQPATVREWLTDIIEATDLFEDKLSDGELSTLIQIFIHSINFNPDLSSPTAQTITNTLKQLWMVTPSHETEARLLPILNRLFIGREQDVKAIYRRFGIEDQSQRQPLTIVRGWPGVGKTALMNVIAHDEQVKNAFSDGLLWANVGRNGDIFSIFKSWAKQLGALHLAQIQDLNALLSGLRMVLKGRDLLILADDVWTKEQGLYIKQVVDLSANTLLITTRFTEIAITTSDIPSDIYILDTLSEAHSVELISLLAPEPAKIYQHRLPQLARVLEGLPLALRVAGPTLQYYHEMHFDIITLLDEFENNYNRLLDSVAPNDRFDEETGQTPTIELLFQRSVETLSADAQLAFMALGVFKHKPATFDAKALQSVWAADDPKPLIMTLIGRGLMDTTPNKRYHVHQTLHMYANKLLRFSSP